MFFGQYKHQLDQKGRMRIPAKFKADLGSSVHFLQGSNKCLYVFSEDGFNDYAKELIESAPINNLERQKIRRAIFASGYTIEEDNQGRFTIPQYLKAHAGINKNIVFIGVGDHVELWDEDNWNSYSQDIYAHYDEEISSLNI